jgi:hypothetical protein
MISSRAFLCQTILFVYSPRSAAEKTVKDEPYSLPPKINKFVIKLCNQVLSRLPALSSLGDVLYNRTRHNICKRVGVITARSM